jgi:hypothetical protein
VQVGCFDLISQHIYTSMKRQTRRNATVSIQCRYTRRRKYSPSLSQSYIHPIPIQGCARSHVVQDTHCAWERISSDQKIPQFPGETLT